MLDVAVEDLQYIHYPLRIHQSACSASGIYTKSVSVKQEEQEQEALIPRLGLGMDPSYPPSGESGGNEQDQAYWPVHPQQQVPWNQQGDRGPTQTPTESQHHHQTSDQQPQQPDMSLLYGAVNPTRPGLQPHLPLRNDDDQQQSRIHHSFGPGPGSFVTAGSYSSPSSLTTSLSNNNQPCLCSMLGQPCTCSRSFARPRFQRVDQSFTSSSSSSTGGIGDTNSSHSSLIKSPVHLHHPYALKSSASPSGLDQTPTSMGGGWMPNARSMPAYAEDGTVIQSPYPHPINTQLSSQMSSLYHSPGDSPSTSQAQTQASNPAISYLYQALAPASQYSSSPSNDLGLSLAGQSTDSTETSTSRSDYRSADSGLPKWPSRPTTASASPMSHSVSHMPSITSRGSFATFSLNRQPSSSSSSSGLTTYDGYERQARSNALSSLSTSSSPSKLGLSLQHDGVNGASPPMDRFSTEEERWNAILNRTHAADAFFIYGALTTRIYCRPSCASKRPDRNRVVFFPFPDAPAKAEHSGFRACKRCKPRTPGTADACVLAVGQCLRHITQAALLGESEEIDSRLKKKTLKEYSTDYGVSAFHFHRTLKSVSTLTPGDYSKACHALVLQDEIGMDHKDGQMLTAVELQQRLRGWSSRRARRAVGNILPSTYARGFPGIKVYYIYSPGTRFGDVCILYSKGEETICAGVQVGPMLDTDKYAGGDRQCTVMATLIGDDSLARVQKRAPSSIAMPEQSEWLRALVEDLDRKGLREVQMPTEVIPWVRRARVWSAVKNALEVRNGRAAGKRTNNSEGDEDDEYEDEGLEEDMSPVNFAASGSR